jgi:hypothetical protein
MSGWVAEKLSDIWGKINFSPEANPQGLRHRGLSEDFE